LTLVAVHQASIQGLKIASAAIIAPPAGIGTVGTELRALRIHCSRLYFFRNIV
jgi:hypothetical protein